MFYRWGTHLGNPHVHSRTIDDVTNDCDEIYEKYDRKNLELQTS